MRRWREILICVALSGALALVVPVAASASGPGTSAGDQQYVDPFANTNGGSGTSHPSTPAANSSPSPPAATSSSGTPSSSAASSSAASSSAASSSSSTNPTATTASGTSGKPSRTLPYTGFDLWLGAGLGLLLLAGGLGLRRKAPSS